MRAGPISAVAAAHDLRAVSVTDSKLPAISAARTTQYRLSHRRAGRSCAAIASAQVEHNRAPEEGDALNLV